MSGFLHRFFHSLAVPIRQRTRLMLALAVVPLAIAATQRIWTIHFAAPQYPNGLDLNVYTYTIHGGNDGRDLAEINTLNHYVGMRKLDPAVVAKLTTPKSAAAAKPRPRPANFVE